MIKKDEIDQKDLAEYQDKVFSRQIDYQKKEDKKLVNDLFKISLEQRNNEIGRYWQRTIYFVGFIAVFVVNFYSKKNADILPLILATFISWCWYFTTRGSKYWQENWEKHVDYLETIRGTRLFFTYPAEDKCWCLLHGAKFSVSRANSLIALAISFVLSFESLKTFLCFFCNKAIFDFITNDCLLCCLMFCVIVSIVPILPFAVALCLHSKNKQN